MHKPTPRVIALLSAIAVAGLHVWTFPHFILDGLGVEPTGMSLREALQIQSIDRLPIQHYQYPIAALLAFSTFGLVYFGQVLRTRGGWLIIASFAMPLLSNFLLPLMLPVYLPIPTALALALWLIISGRKDPLFLPSCYSLGVNLAAAIAMPIYLKDLWALMT